jgi:tripartite-type tricarboxylate transporter receptor subunit TctC
VKRSQLFPEVPTFAEAGFPDGALVPWYGFMVPHNTPPAIVKLINTEINEALKSADVRDKLFKGGGEPAAPATLEELDRLLKSDTTKYVELIKRANITVE